MSSVITVRQKGDFSKALSWMERAKEATHSGILDKYGKEGVELLRNATPKDTGRTAAAWSYYVRNDGKTAVLSFLNSNFQDGVQVAFVIQYGHLMPSGYYVEGVDYINPAIQPLFERLGEEMWKEITR